MGRSQESGLGLGFIPTDVLCVLMSPGPYLLSSFQWEVVTRGELAGWRVNPSDMLGSNDMVEMKVAINTMMMHNSMIGYNNITITTHIKYYNI